MSLDRGAGDFQNACMEPSALRVRVPASTSNLGPGFDTLGLALDLMLEVEARPALAHRCEELAGSARSWPAPEHNLLFRAFDAARAALGLEPLAIALRAHSEIPLARGLGSSGAAIAAGLLLGAGWEEPRRVHRARAVLLRLGAELEGHPDNSTASLLGGCTLAIPASDGLTVIEVEVAPTIGFGVAWPATPLETERARAVLPREVPFADAVENPRRLAALLAGLSRGDGDLVRLGIEDRLHVRHRLPLIPGGAAALRAALEAGAWGATVSGSGSALIALAPGERAAEAAEAMRAVLDRHAPPAEGRALAVARGAPEPARGP